MLNHFIYIFLLITFSSVSLCQSWEKLYRQAHEQFANNDFKASLNTTRSALVNAQREFGERSEEFTNTLGLLSSIYYSMGDFYRAIDNYTRQKDIISNLKGKNNEEYARALNNLSASYQKLGRYAEAEPILLETIDIKEKIFGILDTSYAVSINNLGELYQSLGRYPEAEKLYLQALEIKKEKLGTSDVSYAVTLYNLSYLYRILGNNDKAQELIEQALFIFQSKLGDDDPMVALAQFEQASVYISQGKMLAAEAILYRIQEIQTKSAGESSSQYAITLYNLANLYIRTYNHQAADSLLALAIQIAEDKIGKSVPFYSDCLNSYGIVKWVLGDLDESKDMLEEAVFWRKNLFGEKSPLYASTLSNLAGVYKDLGNMTRAEALYKESQSHFLMQLDKYFPYMSEVERLNFNHSLKERLDMFYCFAVERMKDEPGILGDVYNQRLATKAVLLKTSRNIREKIVRGGNQELINKFDRWKKLKEELALLYSLSKKQLLLMDKNIDSLEEAANSIEKELSSVMVEIKDINSKEKNDWKEIQQSLKQNEAAIEIIRVDYFDKGWTDDAFYGALILTKESRKNPELVILHHANYLDSMYLFYYKRSIMNKIPDEDSYKFFWEQIDDKLEGKNIIYLSTDGIYNNININTLKKPDGTYVIDERNIRLVSSTSGILKTETPAKKSTFLKEACLIGNPKFNKDTVPNLYINPAHTREANVLNYDIINNKKIIPVAPLPGTEDEVNKIDSLLAEKKWKVDYYTGEQASENTLKSINNPNILHIATHGYFLGDEELKKHEKVFGVRIEKALSDPLLRSGLLLAGAGEALNSQEFNYSSDNGIFTAYEALNLNLENTSLVVLSACETGLGQVLKGEGVYGLQRAFQIAGAEDVIMSLWVVNDMVTQESMTRFYKYWLSGKGIGIAFRNAQMELRNKYPEPYYWGGFVIVGK